MVSKPKLFHQAVLCSRGCPEELLLLHLPAECTVIGTLQLGCSPPCTTLPEGCAVIFTEVQMSCGWRKLTDPKIRIFPGISLALSPRFATNALLGMSRPVGKGPRRLPKKPSTTPGGAAIFRWDAEANKLYAFFRPFPPEMRVCGDIFHCIHWNKNANNNIIRVRI